MDSAVLRLFDATVRLEMQLWASAETAVNEAVGHKLGSIWALRAIEVAGVESRVQDLAVTLGITVGAASKIVDRLEAAGFVERTPHETDGRSHRITPTKLGEKTLRKAMRALTRAVGASLANGASEISIEGLAANLERISGAHR